eukprot:scaffold12065_cov73-Skeletonema_dohrnii-CCMP3373.AAC.2
MPAEVCSLRDPTTGTLAELSADCDPDDPFDHVTCDAETCFCNLRNVSLRNLSVDCGVAEEVGISDVSCDVPQCCSVCNGYV